MFLVDALVRGFGGASTSAEPIIDLGQVAREVGPAVPILPRDPELSKMPVVFDLDELRRRNEARIKEKSSRVG